MNFTTLLYFYYIRLTLSHLQLKFIQITKRKNKITTQIRMETRVFIS